MLEDDIQELISRGWWVSVTPVSVGGEWKFTCGIYKKYEKSGNWVTDTCKSFANPEKCYDWAHEYLERKIEWNKKQLTK